jgi:hypothetical protein
VRRLGAGGLDARAAGGLVARCAGVSGASGAHGRRAGTGSAGGAGGSCWHSRRLGAVREALRGRAGAGW